MKIIVILIAYNTKKTLARFYKQLRKYYSGHVILVDNKSEDGTYELSKKLGIESYQNKSNLGYGGNLKRAIDIALKKGAETIIDIHPDGEYLPSVIPTAINMAKRGDEFVLGDRFATPTETVKRGMYFWKLLPIKFLNFVGNLVLGTKIKDLHQGFRVYSRKMLSKINYQNNSNNYLFSFELIAQAVAAGVKITQVPVKTRYSGEKRGASFRHSIDYSLGTFKVLGRFLLAKWGTKITYPLTLILLVLLSSGQTLGMYFWQDDAAVLFKLQNIAGPAGFYGAGPFGGGAYKYTITPFIPFYHLFGMHPFGYFLIGLILLILATFALYTLASELFKDKKAGFFSAAVFAAGYVGSNAMLKVSNSWQNNIGLILSVLMLWSLVKHLRSRDLRYYFLALGLFAFQIEFVFVRSHSLVFAVFALDALFNLFPLKNLRIFRLVFRQLPFWALFYWRYLSQAALETSALGTQLAGLFEKKIELLPSLFGSIGNIFVVDNLQKYLVHLLSTRVETFSLLVFLLFSWVVLTFFGAKKVVKLATLILLVGSYGVNHYLFSLNLYWYRSLDGLLASALGMYTVVFFLMVALAIWPRSKAISIGLAFGVINVILQVFGYFIKYPEGIFSTTHRYLNYATVGYSIAAGGFTYYCYRLLRGRRMAILPLILVVGTNTLLSFNYQRSVVQEGSKPTRRFYASLKEYVPLFNKGSIFYFDVANDARSKTQFGDFFSVGSMPNSTAIAVHYNVDRYDLSLVTNYDELLAKLSSNEDSLENLYTFYYDASLGLIDTTESAKKLLQEGSAWQDISELESLLPFSPVELNFVAQVSTRRDLAYPYSQGGTKPYSHTQKVRMIAYLLSRLSYYSTVKVTTLSEWMYQEKTNLVDNDSSTSWRGHRIYWHDNRHEQITVDLGQIKNVNNVIWTNWQHTLTPTSYEILTSIDGSDWQVVKVVKSGKEMSDGQKVVDEFDSTQARYVRMDITKTLSDDSPAISEFEVVDSAFSGVDPIEADNFIVNPFVNIQNQMEMNEILFRIAPLTFLDVEITTDKETVTKKVPVGRFNGLAGYTLLFSPRGTRLVDVNINLLHAPLKVEVQSVKLRNLSFEEAKAKGLVKEFAKN